MCVECHEMEYTHKRMPMFNRKFNDVEIVIEGKTYSACKKLISGGSKTIFDLGDGYVIGVILSSLVNRHQFIDTEVALSKKLLKLGLRAQEYEKITATINGKDVPVLRMPHFSALTSRGMQVRDSKNAESSCGNSLIFGSLENLICPHHWDLILKDIAHEVAVYLLHQFDFHSDSFNLVIEDTQTTTTASTETKPTVFTDLKQSLHLYFFDFSSKSALYVETINYEFLELDETDESIIANEAAIISSIHSLKSRIKSTILTTVSEDEYAHMMTADNNNPVNYEAAIRIMNELSTQAFEQAWDKLAVKVKDEMLGYINGLPESDKMNQFASRNFKLLIEEMEEMKQVMIKFGF